MDNGKTINYLIAMLGVFKYVNKTMPAGFSFITFQLIAFSVDFYKNPRELPFSNYLVHALMFPVILCGPILRYGDIEKQIEHREVSTDKMFAGFSQFIVGLAKKQIIADALSNITSAVFLEDVHVLGASTLWLGAIAYMVQIYFDFSGYSNMAIGLAEMFGFNLKKNFDHPYSSKSITEFWRRWHISLGSFFKDYVYIPLGGNRVNKFRWLFNMLIVWLLTGIWHGNTAHFLLWGLYFFVLLIIEKMFLKKYLDKYPFIAHIYTLGALLGGWILFRSNSLMNALRFGKRMIFNSSIGSLSEWSAYAILENLPFLGLGILFLLPVVYKKIEEIKNKHPHIYEWMMVALLLLDILYLVVRSYSPFLYAAF